MCRASATTLRPRRSCSTLLSTAATMSPISEPPMRTPRSVTNSIVIRSGQPASPETFPGRGCAAGLPEAFEQRRRLVLVDADPEDRQDQRGDEHETERDPGQPEDDDADPRDIAVVEAVPQPGNEADPAWIAPVSSFNPLPAAVGDAERAGSPSPRMASACRSGARRSAPVRLPASRASRTQ